MTDYDERREEVLHTAREVINSEFGHYDSTHEELAERVLELEEELEHLKKYYA